MKRELFVSKTGFSPLLRLVATVLIPVQLLSVWPTAALLAADTTQSRTVSTPPATPVPVTVNRTVPEVPKVAAPLRFSAAPSDSEFVTARLFPEPLLPLGTENPTPEENRALADAILQFAQTPDPDHTAPLKQFLASYPNSVWRVSLLTNLGLLQRRGAYWSEALASWQEAWSLGKDEQDPTKKLIVDRALAQLAELTARIGRVDDLTALIADAGDRDVCGAAEKWAEAKQSLFLMNTEPTKSYRCGPFAVGRIYAAQHPGKALPEMIRTSVSTDHGTSLEMVRNFAATLGMNYQVAFRSAGAPVIIPCVVNWKVGHYAALSRNLNGRYVVEDPTFSDDFVISKQALDQEASGYFLVPSGDLPAGWRNVDTAEAQTVWGRGATSPGTPPPPPCLGTSLKCPSCGNPSNPHMAGYNIDPSRINLTLSDTPLFYQPPRGPMVSFTVNYSQRDVSTSSIPTFPCLGAQWNFDWVCFVVDDPSNVTTSTYGPGGGTLTYSPPGATNYTSTGANTGTFWPQMLNHAVLERTSATSYVRHFPDGSQQIFGLADSSSPNKRIYMTEYDDPAGNKMVYTYDPTTLRLSSVTDAIGQVTTLGYVSDNPASSNGDYYRVASVTDPFGRSATMSYNASGQLAQITDTAGFTSQFTYGTSNFITTLTTPYGNTAFVSNDVGADRSLLATDPEGAKEFVQFKYNMVPPDNGAPVPSAAGLLTNTSYQQYRTSYYWDKKAYAEAPGDYNKAHLMHWLHTPDESTMADVLESEKQPYEGRVYYNYYGQDHAYDESASGGNLVTKMARVLDDGTTQLYQFDYNAQGKRTKMVTPGNAATPPRTTTFSYAANGLDVIGVYQENPAGPSTDSYSVAADKLASFTYDTGGKHLVISSTDTSGQTTSFTYNSFGQQLTMTDALSHTTAMVYDRDDDSDGVSDGYLLSVTGPASGATTQFQYDGFGRPWKITNSDSDTVTLAYEMIGGVATKTLNRVTQTTYPDGTTEQTLYDRLDPQWIQDRLGHWTELFHDKMRRVGAVLDPLGQITQYDWCNCGSLESIVDPAGHQTSWVRDEQGRVLNKIYPDNSVVTYDYENTTSRLRSVTDAKGQRANYQYNIDDSIKQVSWTDSSGAALSPPTATVSYTYDNAYSRVLTMTDGIGTTQYGYNTVTSPAALGAGRLASVDGPWGSDTITYSYDELGRVIGRSIDGANNTSSFGYDSLGRLHTNTNPLCPTGTLFTYNYVGVTGRLDNVAYPNGQTTQFSYFGASGSRRLQEIKNLDASATPAVISQFDYAYDAIGNISSWTQNNSGLTHPRQSVFGYDAIDQLGSASQTEVGTGTQLQQQAYRYDAAGNRTNVQNGNSVATETPNSLNQLTQVSGGGMMRFAGTLSKPGTVTVGGNAAQMDSTNTSFEGYAAVPAGTTTPVHVIATDGDGVITDKYTNITPNAVTSQAFTYDLNGNTTASGPTGAPTATYGWDAADRLTSVTQGANVTTFEYDGMGRRVREKLNGTETRHWVWNGLELCEERDAGNNVTKRFYRQGEQIAGGAYYSTRDHLGNVRELVGNDGATVRARYEYDVYGRRSANLILTGAVESDFGFTGHQEFVNLGLVGAPLRFYQPIFGRWLNRDPIHEEGGLNLYDYVKNAPSETIDPLGEDGLGTRVAAWILIFLLNSGDISLPISGSGTGGWLPTQQNGVPVPGATPEDLAQREMFNRDALLRNIPNPPIRPGTLPLEPFEPVAPLIPAPVLIIVAMLIPSSTSNASETVYNLPGTQSPNLLFPLLPMLPLQPAQWMCWTVLPIGAFLYRVPVPCNRCRIDA